MPKQSLGVSEWYPVLTLGAPEDDIGDGVQEFSDEEIAEFESLLKQFDRWQGIIATRFGKPLPEPHT